MNKTAISQANNTVGTLNMSKAIISNSLDQVTAKEYLQASIFPKLEVALNSVSILVRNKFETHI